jgi:hypothetical protein
LVKEPSFSVWVEAGRKNTSVGICSGESSPDSTSGESYQKAAVSVSTTSRTTIHSSLAIPIRWALPLAEPTAGFSPATIRPLTSPVFIMRVVW